MQVDLHRLIDFDQLRPDEKATYQKLQTLIDKIAADMHCPRAIPLRIAPLQMVDSMSHGHLFCSVNNNIIVIPHVTLKALSAKTAVSIKTSQQALSEFYEKHQNDPLLGLIEISDDERAKLAIEANRIWSHFVSECPDEPNKLQAYLRSVHLYDLSMNCTMGCLIHLLGAWVSEEECKAMLVHEVTHVAKKHLSHGQLSRQSPLQAERNFQVTFGITWLVCFVNTMRQGGLFSWTTVALGIITFAATHVVQRVQHRYQVAKRMRATEWEADFSMSQYPELIPVFAQLMKKYLIFDSLPKVSEEIMRQAICCRSINAIYSIYKRVVSLCAERFDTEISYLERWKFWQAKKSVV